eukprot:4950283-Pyramimonas_sp.AAC.1
MKATRRLEMSMPLKRARWRLSEGPLEADVSSCSMRFRKSCISSLKGVTASEMAIWVSSLMVWCK